MCPLENLFRKMYSTERGKIHVLRTFGLSEIRRPPGLLIGEDNPQSVDSVCWSIETLTFHFAANLLPSASYLGHIGRTPGKVECIVNPVPNNLWPAVWSRMSTLIGTSFCRETLDGCNQRL